MRRWMTALALVQALAALPCHANSLFLWAPKADVIGQQFGRGLHAGGVINDKIYVAGGGFIGTSLWLSYKDAAVYDPVGDAWSALPDMTYLRTAPASAVALVGGQPRIYVIGGMDLSDFPIGHFSRNDIEEYDPSAGSWRTIGTAFPDFDTWGACAAVVDNKIYVLGGIGAGFSGFSTRLTAYDPDTESFAAHAAMPVGTSDGTCAAVGRKIYWLGGYDDASGGWGSLPSKKVYVYDVDLDQWATVATTTPTGRANAAAIAVGTTIYVMGGWDGSGTYFGMYNTIDGYDTVATSWTAKMPDPLACVQDDGGTVRGRAGFTLHAASDGTAQRIYAVGGNIGISIPTRCNESSPSPATSTDTTPPTFGGVEATVELASCTAPVTPKVRLQWRAGTDLTPPVVYNIYRGTSPLFVPGPANLIAGQVVGLNYTDTLTTGDCFQSFWYVVRAQDSAVPPNEDTNTNRVQIDLACPAPAVPADIDNRLRAVKDALSQPSLDWSSFVPGPGESHYHVRRTISKLGLPGAIVNEPTAETWIDTSAPGVQYLYQVRSANDCETESAN